MNDELDTGEIAWEASAYDAWANSDDEESYDEEAFGDWVIAGAASDISRASLEQAAIDRRIADIQKWYASTTIGPILTGPTKEVAPDMSLPIGDTRLWTGVVPDPALMTRLPSGLPRFAGDVQPVRGVSLREQTRMKAGQFASDKELERFLAETSRLDFDDLIRATPRGRLSFSEQKRRDELARVVQAARERGALVQALARVLNRPVSTIHSLASAKPKITK
jgi:hypothetical protein